MLTRKRLQPAVWLPALVVAFWGMAASGQLKSGSEFSLRCFMTYSFEMPEHMEEAGERICELKPCDQPFASLPEGCICQPEIPSADANTETLLRWFLQKEVAQEAIEFALTQCRLADSVWDYTP